MFQRWPDLIKLMELYKTRTKRVERDTCQNELVKRDSNFENAFRTQTTKSEQSSRPTFVFASRPTHFTY